MKNIRGKAVCLFRHHGRVLLTQGFDSAKNEHYLMPIGGGIEFGELAVDAIRREVREEIQQEIHHVQQLQVLENIFSFDGQQGHEIVFVYAAEFSDRHIYAMQEIMGQESDGSIYHAAWYSAQGLEALKLPIYPQGIESLLFQPLPCGIALNS